jgi:hypothetical protein
MNSSQNYQNQNQIEHKAEIHFTISVSSSFDSDDVVEADATIARV